MNNLKKLLKEYKGKVLLAIFPHPDDESFVAGGLFQVAREFGIKTIYLCLTKGERGINSLGSQNLIKTREKELKKAVKILKIDKLIQKGFTDSRLREEKSKWVKVVKDTITKEKPDLVLTFDHSGITGHPDHVVSCHEILNIIRSVENKPILLWRIPDKQEKDYFRLNKALIHASRANFVLNFGLMHAINKIKAIFSHQSQMKGFRFKLQIFEWFLFNHQELYYKVDLRKKYKYRFVEYRS